jgi:hypothetical protein
MFKDKLTFIIYSDPNKFKFITDDEIKNLEANTCILRVSASFLPFSLGLNGEIIEIPNFLFDEKIIINNRKPAIDLLYYKINRIKSYLNFEFDSFVPVTFGFASRDGPMMQPARFFESNSFYFEFDPTNPKKHEKEFTDRFQRVKELVRSVKEGTSIDRGIVQYGSALGFSDNINEFLSLWVGLEILAIEDVKINLDTYRGITSQDIFGILSRKKPNYKIVAIIEFLKKELGDNKYDYIKAAYNIRNKIVHGGISLEAYYKVHSIVYDLMACLKKSVR